MNKTDAVKVLKLSLGSILAIIIASFFKLQYSTVAGVITLLVVKDINSEEFGEFYKFKTISYCPIDLNGVVIEMLTNEERDWLNNYHKIVFEKLSPYLNDEEIEFLKVQTREI